MKLSSQCIKIINCTCKFTFIKTNYLLIKNQPKIKIKIK